MARSTPFELSTWYPSEPAKRALGRICQRVNETGQTVKLLGTAGQPLLELANIDDHPEEPGDITLTIDEAKANWPAVTTAAAIYKTRFRIMGKKHPRAVLYKLPDAHHPAEQYFRSTSVDADRLANRIEVLAKEVRKLGRKLGRLRVPSIDELQKVGESLARSAELIDRRFREIWRLADGTAAFSGAPHYRRPN